MVLKMMKKNNIILVTGGSGLIGTYLKNELPEAIYVSSKDYDLTNQIDVESMFIKYKPDIVIHLAAKVGGIIDNINHPVTHLDDNILINTLVLKYAYKYKVSRFISILSCVMYAKDYSGLPFKEESIYEGSPHDSIFSYAMVKRVMATQIDNYNKEYGTKYNYLIPCNLYGPMDKDDKIIPVMINKIIDAKNSKDFITLFGDGTPVRQFMHSKDVAKIIKKVIDENIFESFNIAPDDSFTIDEVARIVIDVADANYLEIRYDETKPNGQIRRDIDVTRFKKIIPDYEFISLRDGIKDCFNTLIKN
jgi:GDP-L-fucose synthase